MFLTLGLDVKNVTNLAGNTKCNYIVTLIIKDYNMATNQSTLAMESRSKAAKCSLFGWECALLASGGQTVFLFDVNAFVELHNIMDKPVDVRKCAPTDWSMFSELRKKVEAVAESYFGH